MVTLAVGVMSRIPLWCNSCADVHRFSWQELERIIYTLHGCATEPDASDHDRMVNEYETCWNEVLGWSHDTEMYYEWVNGGVESRVNHTVDCVAHDEYQGPHHHPECHYWDEEDERA